MIVHNTGNSSASDNNGKESTVILYFSSMAKFHIGTQQILILFFESSSF